MEHPYGAGIPRGRSTGGRESREFVAPIGRTAMPATSQKGLLLRGPRRPWADPDGGEEVETGDPTLCDVLVSIGSRHDRLEVGSKGCWRTTRLSGAPVDVGAATASGSGWCAWLASPGLAGLNRGGGSGGRRTLRRRWPLPSPRWATVPPEPMKRRGAGRRRRSPRVGIGRHFRWPGCSDGRRTARVRRQGHPLPRPWPRPEHRANRFESTEAG